MFNPLPLRCATISWRFTHSRNLTVCSSLFSVSFSRIAAVSATVRAARLTTLSIIHASPWVVNPLSTKNPKIFSRCRPFFHRVLLPNPTKPERPSMTPPIRPPSGYIIGRNSDKSAPAFQIIPNIHARFFLTNSKLPNFPSSCENAASVVP